MLQRIWQHENCREAFRYYHRVLGGGGDFICRYAVLLWVLSCTYDDRSASDIVAVRFFHVARQAFLELKARRGRQRGIRASCRRLFFAVILCDDGSTVADKTN